MSWKKPLHSTVSDAPPDAVSGAATPAQQAGESPEPCFACRKPIIRGDGDLWMDLNGNYECPEDIHHYPHPPADPGATPEAQIPEELTEKVNAEADGPAAGTPAFEVYGPQAEVKGWDFIVYKSLKDVEEAIWLDIDALKDGEEVRIVYRKYTKEQWDEVVYE
jgi:hypothetical protein